MPRPAAKNRVKGEMGKLDFVKMKHVCSPKAPARMTYRQEKILADLKQSLKANQHRSRQSCFLQNFLELEPLPYKIKLYIVVFKNK